MEEEISNLRQKGAVSEVVSQVQEGFFSVLFLVPKKEGKFRPVLNLKALNSFLTTEHFKMEGMHTVRDLLQQGDWMTRLDLKDAYFAVPVHPTHQRYLRFRYKEQTFQFNALPFGLSTAPRVFTKILRPVAGLVRELGVRCVFYLDDVLIMNQEENMALQQTWAVVDLLEALGFLVNFNKSVLTPSQEITFLGFNIDSRQRQVRLPGTKITSIQREAQSLLSQQEVSARTLASFIGKLSSAILAVYPAPLHYRSLQRLKHQALHRAGYDSPMWMSVEAQEDLRWWIDHLGAWNGRAIQDPTPEWVIETDASKKGWGAYCNGDFTGGCWSQEESRLHINVLELLAATFGVQAFCKSVQVSSVLLKTDNTTVVAYINKMGGTRSPMLIQLAKDLWQWCLKRGIHLRAEHLSGELNITADFLSRHLRDRTDWVLNPELFAMINSKMGPLDIDLFATRFSTQLQRFVSWRPDPMAEATDAFVQDWCQGMGYAHPPWCLISRVLAKAQAQKATLVLIVPLWQTQAWFPQLTAMLVEEPILLPQGPDTLSPSPNCDSPMKENPPQLIACKVSGSASKQKEFQKRLSVSSLHPGGARQSLTTTLPGRNGKCGVPQKVSIPLMQIYQRF